MVKSIRKANGIMRGVNGALIDLPAPKNISYQWGYGSLLGALIGLQVISGILLAMHYNGGIDMAFRSVGHITRDVGYGYVLRSMHSNGASMAFICLYLHIGRGIYYGSYRNREWVWMTGILLYVLMMGTAFIGYVLPWGQMSYWAATVITNLLTAIPYIGESVVQWLWGGYSVSGATLSRFYSFHYLMPFMVAGLGVVHLVMLHERGSSNPMGIRGDVGKVPFHAYYTSKDLYGGLMGIGVLVGISLLSPYTLGDAENYRGANALVTPEHIQPEWYFLFIYALLRSIPNKMGGVIALVGSIVVVGLLPWLMGGRVIGMVNRPLGRLLYWGMIGDWGLLTFIGSRPVEEPYIWIGQCGAVYYYLYYMVLGPWVGKLEEGWLSRGVEVSQGVY